MAFSSNLDLTFLSTQDEEYLMDKVVSTVPYIMKLLHIIVIIISSLLCYLA